MTKEPPSHSSLGDGPVDSYLLDLGKGLQWQLSAERQAQPLLESLARGLGLRVGSNLEWPRLVLGFGPTDSCIDRPHERIPREHWNSMNFWDSQIWFNSATGHLFLELQYGGSPNDFFRVWSFVIHTIYGRAINRGGVPLHAALIERNGIGVALAGASGLGKSTCCKRIPEPWRVLSDDQALVLPVKGDGFWAHPFPTWGDVLRGARAKTSPIERRTILSAIFFLEQGQSDGIAPIGSAQTVLRINQSANQIFGCNIARLEQPQRLQTRAQLFENACKLGSAAKAHILRASLGGFFWEKIDEALSGSIHKK